MALASFSRISLTPFQRGVADRRYYQQCSFVVSQLRFMKRGYSSTCCMICQPSSAFCKGGVHFFLTNPVNFATILSYITAFDFGGLFDSDTFSPGNAKFILLMAQFLEDAADSRLFQQWR